MVRQNLPEERDCSGGPGRNFIHRRLRTALPSYTARKVPSRILFLARLSSQNMARSFAERRFCDKDLEI